MWLVDPGQLWMIERSQEQIGGGRHHRRPRGRAEPGTPFRRRGDLLASPGRWCHRSRSPLEDDGRHNAGMCLRVPPHRRVEGRAVSIRQVPDGGNGDLEIRRIPRKVLALEQEFGSALVGRAVRVSRGETPVAQIVAVARGVSSGRLIHAASGMRGALGGRRNRRVGWRRRC